jgi:hypothetical protein
VVTDEQIEQFGIPLASVGIYRNRHRATDDYYLVDRRRLQRHVRREYESIQRDIDALGAMIPPARSTAQREVSK